MKLILIFLAALVPFLPEVGEFKATSAAGVVGASDKAIIAFAPLVALFAWRIAPTALERCSKPLALFLATAAVSTATIPLRFLDTDGNVVVMGLLRLARFGGTVAYALLMLRLFADPRYRRSVAAGWCVGALIHSVLLILQSAALDAGSRISTWTLVVQGNPASVALASLGVLTTSLLFSGSLRKVDARVLSIAGIVLFLGIITSEGRGGWLALLLGLLFLARNLGLRTLLPVAFFVGILAVGAQQSETVNDNFSRLFIRHEGYSVAGDDAETEVSDGARVQTWLNEGAKLVAHPILGHGFFHRGGSSPLWWTGSHNFFLQMFLEVGLLGGGAMLWFFGLLWRSCRTLEGTLNSGAKAALIAIVFGGMGGEYFYGGAPLYCIFVSLCLLAIPDEANAWQMQRARASFPQSYRNDQRSRSRSVNSARSGIPSAASASAPPSPRSTTQSAPST